VGLGSVNYNENATHPRKWVELKAEWAWHNKIRYMYS
jgi:hypothetical protein